MSPRWCPIWRTPRKSFSGRPLSCGRSSTSTTPNSPYPLGLLLCAQHRQTMGRRPATVVIAPHAWPGRGLVNRGSNCVLGSRTACVIWTSALKKGSCRNSGRSSKPTTFAGKRIDAIARENAAVRGIRLQVAATNPLLLRQCIEQAEPDRRIPRMTFPSPSSMTPSRRVSGNRIEADLAEMHATLQAAKRRETNTCGRLSYTRFSHPCPEANHRAVLPATGTTHLAGQRGLSSGGQLRRGRGDRVHRRTLLQWWNTWTDRKQCRKPQGWPTMQVQMMSIDQMEKTSIAAEGWIRPRPLRPRLRCSDHRRHCRQEPIDLGQSPVSERRDTLARVDWSRCRESV